MREVSLFRQEAVPSLSGATSGEVVMIQPLSYRLLTLLFAAMAALVIVFAIFGSYRKRVTVIGQVVPDKGVIKVYASQYGTVVESLASEGQLVKAGDVLLSMSSERRSSTHGEAQAAISEETVTRYASLTGQLAKIREMEEHERKALQEKIDALVVEEGILDGLIVDQKKRLQLTEQSLARFEQVVGSGYVSREQLGEKQRDTIDQKSRLDSLMRDQVSSRRELSDLRYQVDTLAIRYRNQAAEVERGVAVAARDLSESEAHRRIVVVAPETGIVTAVTAQVGQTVDSGRTLLSIVPADAVLQLELYAPSRAMGFVGPGDVVSIRYEAYPYQKFGQYQGVITGIASTPLSIAELTGTNANFSAQGEQSEPLYRMRVRLKSQVVTAYGKSRPLQAGMLLQADLLQEKRKLYEWALAPLYTLTGKL